MLTTQQHDTTQTTDQELDKVDDGTLSDKDLDTVAGGYVIAGIGSINLKGLSVTDPGFNAVGRLNQIIDPAHIVVPDIHPQGVTSLHNNPA